MDLNLDKAAEASIKFSYLANVKLDQDLKEISMILNDVDENKLTEGMYEALTGMESAYNANYLETLHNIEDVFRNQIPALDERIKSLDVNALTVKSNDVSVKKIAVDDVSIL